MRQGARVVVSDGYVRVPVVDREEAPQYVAADRAIVPRAAISTVRAESGKHELAWVLEIANHDFRAFLEEPELVGALLEDLAEGLALEADRAFLDGEGDASPRGIRMLPDVLVASAEDAPDALTGARHVLTTLRTHCPTPFRNPGWILHPAALDTLTETLLLPSGGPADSNWILRTDGGDGGTFLDYPFVTSAAAVSQEAPAIYFGADWGEAWVAAEGRLATVEVSADASFDEGKTLVRAVARHDFLLRRADCFAVYAVASEEPAP